MGVLVWAGSRQSGEASQNLWEGQASLCGPGRLSGGWNQGWKMGGSTCPQLSASRSLRRVVIRSVWKE